MSTAFSTFLQSVLLEAAIDHRVPSGVLDISNDMHREVIAEKLMDRGIAPNVVLEVVNKLALKDGKYPDRQAYNKEGWLVTFPTPEHRAAAIKKKTHFTSDPTHGQGGMNLYYKRKGKQARQQQQAASETEPVDQADQSGEASPQPTDTQPEAPSNGGQSELPQGGQQSTGGDQQSTGDQGQPAAASGEQPENSSGSELPSAGAESEKSEQPNTGGDNGSQAPAEKPAPETSVDNTPALVKLTQEFARQKGWTDTPYGDWNDSNGQHSAVTGLDGQVVPIKFTDRESLKSFAEKKMNEGIVLRETFQRLRNR